MIIFLFLLCSEIFIFIDSLSNCLNKKENSNGELNIKLDKKGNPKIIRWSLRIGQNKDEKIAKWLSRFYTFNDIMLDLFNQYQVETNPLISDSRM